MQLAATGKDPINDPVSFFHVSAIGRLKPGCEHRSMRQTEAKFYEKELLPSIHSRAKYQHLPFYETSEFYR